MEGIELAPELGLLERFANEQVASREKYHLVVFDRNGHTMAGTLAQYSREKGLLVLSGDKDQLSFIRLSEVVHFTLQNASKHTLCLQNRHKADYDISSEAIDVISQIELIEDRLQTNYQIGINFELDESCQAFFHSEELSILIAALEENLAEFAKDDFAKAELMKISKAVIQHRQGDRLRFKLNDSILSISLDLTTSVGFKLTALVESGLNKIL